MQFPKIQELMQQGHFDQALQEVEQVLPEDQLEGQILKSRILWWKGELSKAVTVAKEALETIKTIGTPFHEFKAFINQGYGLAHLRKGKELELVIERANELLPSLKTEPEEIQKEWESALAYLQGFIHFFRGEEQQAFDSIEKSLYIRQAIDNKLEIADTLAQICWMHRQFGTGKRELALDYGQRSLSLSEQLGNAVTKMFALYVIGSVYEQNVEIEKAQIHYERALGIAQQHTHKRFSAYNFNALADIYREREQYGLAIDYYEKSYTLLNQIGDPSAAICLSNIGLVHADKGELERAIEYFQRSLKIWEEAGNKPFLMWGLNSIGWVLTQKGELEQALNYLNKSLTIGEESELKSIVGYSLFLIARIQILQGKLEQAHQAINQSLEVFTQRNDPVGRARCYGILGQINRLQGKPETAIEYYEKGMNLFKKTMKGVSRANVDSWCLFHLILSTQDLKALNKAEKYLQQMQELQQKSPNAFVQLRTRVAEALILKMSRQGIKKLQALEKFKAIVEEPIIDFHMTTLAMFNLCELLIVEMKISDTPEEHFQEIVELTQKLSNLAKTQKSVFLEIIALILQTKISLVKEDIEDANNLLSLAKELAEKKKLHSLLAKIKTEQEIIQTELNKWQELFQRKASLYERLEQARLVTYVQEAKQIQEAWVRPSTDMLDQS